MPSAGSLLPLQHSLFSRLLVTALSKNGRLYDWGRECWDLLYGKRFGLKNNLG
jgi:hypothetical protein